MDSRDNRMAGQRRFHCGIGFSIADFADNHHIGIKTECRHHKVFLCDVVGGTLARTGQRVNHIVLCFAEAVLFDEI